MTSWIIKGLKFILQECAVPIMVSVICFGIEYKVSRRANNKKDVPVMYVLMLNGAEKVKLNEKKIKNVPILSSYITKVMVDLMNKKVEVWIVQLNLRKLHIKTF